MSFVFVLNWVIKLQRKLIINTDLLKELSNKKMIKYKHNNHISIGKIIITLVLLGLCLPNSVYADHFRNGHISWTRIPGTRTVTFTITTAWREDARESFTFGFGDGYYEYEKLGTEIQNVQGNYKAFQLFLTHTYANDNPFIASFSSCCRIANIENGANSNFLVSTVVCLANNNVGSPYCVSPLVIEMNVDEINNYQLATFDPDGTPITYSLFAIQRQGANFIPTIGNNIASVSSSGVISWNTTGATVGQLYQMKVSMSDGCAKSEIDFIIKIKQCNFQPASSVITGGKLINPEQTANINIAFKGTPPWIYRLKGASFDDTTSITPKTFSVSPHETTIYSLEYLSNVCGEGFSSVGTTVKLNGTQLLACYKFNGNVQDSKNLNHGRVVGATLTTDRFGSDNSAYSFDGEGSHIAFPGFPFAIDEYSYAVWVNTNNLTDYSQTIISISLQGIDQVLALSNISGIAKWNFTSYTNFQFANSQVLSTAGASTNEWHFIVATRTLNNLKLYVDGQLVGSVSSGGIPPIYASPYFLNLGARSIDGDVQFFNGKIDDVKIFSGALSSEEVTLLYNEEQGECSTPCSGMIYSINSGDWNSANTWVCGRIPDSKDKVFIKSGHNITVSTNNAKAKKLLNNGQILFSNSSSKLTFK